MNEEQLAEFFERRRGDTSHWSDLPVKANIRRRGSVVFSVRFSPEELLLLRDLAREIGTTISGLIRSAALEATLWPSMVYALTIKKQLMALPPCGRLAVSSTFDLNGTAQASQQPGQPPGDYVFESQDPPSASGAQVVRA
jgi:hypothetical protein